jgi:hypothetical protein
LKQEQVVDIPQSPLPPMLVANQGTKKGKEHYYKREAISKAAVDRYNIGVCFILFVFF